MVIGGSECGQFGRWKHSDLQHLCDPVRVLQEAWQVSFVNCVRGRAPVSGVDSYGSGLHNCEAVNGGVKTAIQPVDRTMSVKNNNNQKQQRPALVGQSLAREKNVTFKPSPISRTSAGTIAAQKLRFAPLWFVIGIALIAAICFMSVISVPAEVKKFLLNDKLLHVGVYGCLMGWFAQIFRHDLTRLLLAAAFVLMGVGMEYVQSMVPSRQFEVLDMIANTCGIVLAWALAYTWMGGILGWIEKNCLSWLPEYQLSSAS